MTARWRLFALLGALPASLPAQSIDVQCPAVAPNDRTVQDACQKALDLFAYVAPQLGLGLAGGNAISGEHATLGGPGRVSAGLRVNILRARIPRADLVAVSTTGAVRSDFTVERRAAPVPVLDAAAGIFRGFPVALTTTLGVDVLVNVAWLPDVSVGDVAVRVAPSGLRLGMGVRVGLIEETPMSPGIAVTWIRRGLPRLDLTATPGNDSLALRNVQVTTSAWRAVVGKSVPFLSVSAGAGQDTYTTTATAFVRVDNNGIAGTRGPLVGIQEITRDNVFASVGLRLPLVSLVGEVGRASGGEVATWNSFGSALAADAVEYASVGLRVRW